MSLSYLKNLYNFRQIIDNIAASSKEDRYYSLSLLKAISSLTDKKIKSLETELRKDADNGVAGNNDTTSWREFTVGDVTSRKYSDKEESFVEIDGADLDGVKQLLSSKGLDPKLAVVETVDLNRLNLMVESGFITEDEMNTVVFKHTSTKKTTGKFHVIETGILEKARESSTEILEYLISEVTSNQSSEVSSSVDDSEYAVIEQQLELF